MFNQMGSKNSKLSVFEFKENYIKHHLIQILICIAKVLIQTFITRIFDYKITFKNSQRENTYSKSVFVPKNRIEAFLKSKIYNKKFFLKYVLH